MPHRGIRTVDQFNVDLVEGPRARPHEEKAKTFAEKLERSYLTNLVIGIMGVILLVQYFRRPEGLYSATHFNGQRFTYALFRQHEHLHRRMVEERRRA